MTVTSTNACAPQTATATYSIIINPLPTASAGGSQTICSNGTATVSGANASNGTISWSENGAGSITAGSTTLTPTYTPTAADAGTTVTLTMTVTSTNACAPQTATATYSVIVSPANTVGSASSIPTLCINTTLNTITHTTTGATGIGIATGLPSGVSAFWSANVISINGTPTVSGTFNYSIPLTGGCGAIYATGTITVTANNTITLSTSGTDLQNVCVNTPILNIVYDISGNPTSVTVTGLPSGVSSSYNSGPRKLTISGTPTLTGTFNYVVNIIGGCGTTTGTIGVKPNNTISFASAVGTNTQTLCINTTITNISYTTTGATGATFSGLPAGVTGSWAANVVTISGTPSVSGTFNYAVTLTGGCGNSTGIGTITVTPSNTIALTSGVGSNSQTRCINTAITSISYTTSGATGAIVSGLPTGVTGSWFANLVTISGTPTTSGTFTYTVTLTGGCGTITTTGTITVTPNNTITLSSVAGTDVQTRCITTPISAITYVTTGATGAIVTGLPTGVTGSWNANVITISGSPSASGTFNYTVTTTGGCTTPAVTTNGTITVIPNNSISLTSAAATNTQTLCINSPVTNITYSTTGATGANITGLPTGVAGSWSANVVTISGTPLVSGNFTYTVTLTGGCGTINTSGTITVTPTNTINRTSVTGTDNQSKCINTIITNISYSTTGATGATVTGLPAGVSSTWATNVVTISGTPTVAGTFNYTITLTGGCGTTSAFGTITVLPNNTIALSSAAGTNAQNICINTAINTITYATTNATGATFSNLPTGVSGNWVANVITISGTPTVSGTFNYTVILTGGCGTITTTGAITVTPNNSILLSSGAGTNTQTKCINIPITNITYTTAGATGASITGLPTGITGTWSANTITISGTPTVSGTFNYMVTLSGGCGSNIANGSITVTPNNTIVLTSLGGTNAQTKCLNTAITNISYATTGATGATFGGLPTGVTGNWTGNVVTIAGTPSTSGTFNYTVTLTGGCGTVTTTGSITVSPNNTILLSSAAGTNTQTKCINAAITPIVYSTTGATGANIVGLPSGVVGNWSANVITINGMALVAGTFPYTITLTGGCGTSTATGTIIINPLPIATAGGSQTICANTTATVSGATSSNGTIMWTENGAGSIISGSTTLTPVYTAASGDAGNTVTLTMTVTSNNACTPQTAIAYYTINVNPVAQVNQPINQVLCTGSSTGAVTFTTTNTVGTTTYSWTNNTTSIGLGSVGSGDITSFSAVNTGSAPVIATIVVTPTFTNGSVSCTGPTKTFTITVNPTAQVNLPTSISVCNGSLSSIIAFGTTNTGGSTSYSWTNSNTSIGLTAAGTGNIAAFTSVNNGSTPLIATIVVTPTFTNGGLSCTGPTKTFTITVDQSILGGAVLITSSTSPLNVGNGTSKITDCHFSAGVLNLTGQTGPVIRWESSTNAGGTWTNLGNAGTSSYTYSGVIATTIFRAVVQSGACVVNSTGATLFIIPNIKPTPISANPPTICEGESSELTSESSFSSSQNLASGGLFNDANPPGWTMDNGIFPANGDNGVNNGFSETNGNTGDEYDSGDGKFAIVRGNRDSFLRTPTFDLIGLSSANLTFNHAYKLDDPGAYAEVRLSLDGGITFSVTLIRLTGDLEPKNQFNAPANAISLDLSPYLGYTNLKLEFFFHGTVDNAGKKVLNVGSSWALENVKIPQVPDPLLTSQWLDLNTNAIISVTNGTRVSVSPAVTTTYEVKSFLNGCSSYGVEGTSYITVTVNKRPTANIGPNQTICYDGTASFSVALTGVAPWTMTYTNGTIPTTVTGINTNPYIFTIPNVKGDANYSITALNDANCTAFVGGIAGSATVSVLVGRAGWWTGLVSTDWFDCMNWEQGLPSNTIDANIIPVVANANRLPVIDKTSLKAIPYGGVASAKDLIVNNNGVITMVSSNNSELQISGNWRNSGSFIPGTGTVTFNGAALNQIQTINAGIKTNETFYNLTTNNLAIAKGISVEDGFELTVANNLSLLSGDLRLTGEAQLVQAGTSANPISGSGKLLRDQQGQKNSFNYNYWSSPVSTNGIDYSLASVLRDGTSMTNIFTDLTNFNPSTIVFGEGAYFADLPVTIPLSIGNRWIWSYSSVILGSNTALDNYNLWKYMGSTGIIKIGEGFTMKGSGGIAPITALHNYVFVGKPNSGTISLSLSKDQSYLVGNPYPSALDANKFIRDNLKDCTGCTNTSNVFTGALYFWDHFGLSNNHYLAEYEGGYATYTLMGGVAGIANSPLTATGTGTKVPQRYIPVAQGFFVDAFLDSELTGPEIPTIVSGGTLVFNNSQRVFVKESIANSLFMRTNTKEKSGEKQSVAEKDTRSKIRLGFYSSNGTHRQLLLGADPSATAQFDIGFDAPMFDLSQDDMFWEINTHEYVIQAVADFNENQTIPLGLVIGNEGKITVKIDALENTAGTKDLYIYDSVTGLYHDIRANDFTISLAVGDYRNRFSLQFSNKTLAVDAANWNDGLVVLYSNTSKVVTIQNKSIDLTVNEVGLFNLAGQAILNWDVKKENQNLIQIPIKNLSSGVYIVKLRTSKGNYSKKIIFK